MKDFFSTDGPIISATAPGRMDVMGGIADYSGSLLLQMPIKQTTTVSIQKRNDGVFNFRTQIAKKKTGDFTINASELVNRSLEESGKIIQSKAGGEWAVYVFHARMLRGDRWACGAAGSCGGRRCVWACGGGADARGNAVAELRVATIFHGADVSLGRRSLGGFH